ncbi:MAG: recombinase family protein [Lachnospiraceae bacterium]|nr:recombinase family protein [Lachnospiraceae bacterium]
MSKDYFIYLRKSRKDIELEQELGDTLVRHRNILLELAKKQRLTITAIYEEVVSGESIANRPKMQKMLSDIETNGCAGVLCMEIERLARGDSVDQGIISRTFSITGTKIITPNKIYDPNNEFDQEYFEFGLFMSRREYKTILRRIQQGRIASVKEGKYIASVAPYGYQRVKIKNGKGYTLEPLKPECDAVRLMFDLYLNGKNGVDYGSYKIAGYLADHGYPTRSGKPWSASSIRTMLKNITYAGFVRWGYRRTEKEIHDGEVTKKTASIPSSDVMIVKGEHEALIDEVTFNRVQKKLKAGVVLSTPANKELKNPLAGLVYCKKCGSLMSRLGEHPHNKYASLRCSNRSCNNISSPIFLVEEEILAFLKQWIKSQNVDVDPVIVAANKEKLSLLERNVTSLQKELDDLEIQINSTYTLLEKGVYTEEIFTMRQKKLSSLRSSATRRLKSTKKEITHLETINKRILNQIPHVSDLIYSYEQATSAHDKNLILRELVESVKYNKDKPNKKGQALNKNFTLEIVPKIQ